MRRDAPEVVCSKPHLLEAITPGSNLISVAATCTGAHGHAGRACDVHRQRADETIPQVQSRPSAGHLVAIGSRESAAHGRRLAPDSMLLRSGPEREIVGQVWEGRSLRVLEGRKTHRISG